MSRRPTSTRVPETAIQNSIAVTVVALTGLLVGCGSDGSSAPEGDWDAPAAYEFTVESSCGERSFLGRYHVVVRSDEVADVEGLDDRSRELLEHPEYRALVPTLGDLLDEADQARAGDADLVEVVRDDVGGRPLSIEIDWLQHATDDEACYEISDYEAHG